jgi:hypothetical protein
MNQERLLSLGVKRDTIFCFVTYTATIFFQADDLWPMIKLTKTNRIG